MPKQISHFKIKSGQVKGTVTQELNANLLAETILENIVVVGTEQHYKNPANKLMFAAHAIKFIKSYFTKGKLTLIIFTPGYTQSCLSVIKKAAILHNSNCLFLEIQTITELINYINTGDVAGKNDIRKDGEKAKGVKILNMYSFAHGVTYYVTYLLTNDELSSGNYSPEFGFNEVIQLNKNSFLPNSQLAYFSCRTGIGTPGEDVTAAGPQIAASLAQKISDHLNVSVLAYPCRTDYTDTWGTTDERRYYDNPYYVYDAVHSKPSNYKEFKSWRSQLINIENKYPWNDNGAYNNVKAGTTPKGTTYSIIKFVPQKK